MASGGGVDGGLLGSESDEDWPSFEEEEDYCAALHMSRLSLESGGGEDDDDDDDDDKAPCKEKREAAKKSSCCGLLGDDSHQEWSSQSSSWVPSTPAKEYTYERRERERRLERAWKARRSNAAAGAECRVQLVRPRGGGGSGRISLDKEEVRACHELMLDLPSEDWRVELPAAFSDMQEEDTGVAGGSDIGNWRIARPGDDPVVVKERIKVWAQAVALDSARRRGNRPG